MKIQLEVSMEFSWENQSFHQRSDSLILLLKTPSNKHTNISGAPVFCWTNQKQIYTINMDGHLHKVNNLQCQKMWSIDWFRFNIFRRVWFHVYLKFNKCSKLSSLALSSGIGQSSCGLFSLLQPRIKVLHVIKVSKGKTTRGNSLLEKLSNKIGMLIEFFIVQNSKVQLKIVRTSKSYQWYLPLLLWREDIVGFPLVFQF